MYTRDETLEEIKRVFPYLIEIESYQDGIKVERGKYKTVNYLYDDVSEYSLLGKTKGWVLALCLIVPVILSFLIGFNTNYGMVILFGTFLGPFIGTAFYFAIGRKIGMTLENKAREAANIPTTEFNNKIRPEIEKKVTFFEESINEAIGHIADTSIPGKYLNTTTLKIFNDYLKDFKAENFKECVLLFDQELKYNEQLRQLKGLETGLRKIDSQLNSVNSSLNTLNQTQKQVENRINQIEYNQRS